jgi:hypothetical protein
MKDAKAKERVPSAIKGMARREASQQIVYSQGSKVSGSHHAPLVLYVFYRIILSRSCFFFFIVFFYLIYLSLDLKKKNGVE